MRPAARVDRPWRHTSLRPRCAIIYPRSPRRRRG